MPNRVLTAQKTQASDTAKTPHASFSVGAAATEIAATNQYRIMLFIGNDHATQTLYLSLGGTAEVAKGITLRSGQSIAIDFFNGSVSAIASGAATTCTVTEV